MQSDLPSQYFNFSIATSMFETLRMAARGRVTAEAWKP